MNRKLYSMAVLFFVLLLGACGGEATTPDGKDPNKKDPNKTITIPDTVKEASSSEVFKTSLKIPGGTEEQILMGTGIRKKYSIVSVYAMGFYVDPKPAAKALAAWKDKKLAEVQKDAKFYETILNTDFGKGIRLVMVRDVDAETMAEAFADSLDKRLKSDEGKKALEAFKKFFDKEMKVKDEIIFGWDAKGELHTAVNGKVKGVIKTKELAKALLDVYIGAEPISEDAKNNFAGGLSWVFHKSEGK